MAGRALPGLGLIGDWDLGEDNWKDENDANLRAISVLLQGRVDDIVAAEPGAPAEGDIVVLDETHATHPNEIAVYDEAAWVYLAPHDGMILYNLAVPEFVTYTTAGGWETLATGGGGGGGGIAGIVTDATANRDLAAGDESKYIRMDSATAQTVTVQPDATYDFAIGTQIYVERAGTGLVSFEAGTGVTILTPATIFLRARYSSATLTKIAADTWALIGDLAPDSSSITGTDQGIAFPSSPAISERFFRTDRNIEYFYDGTRWLSTTLYTFLPSTVLASQTADAQVGRHPVPFKGLYDIWLERWQTSSYLNGAAEWILSIRYLDAANAGTILASTNTSGDPANTWVHHETAINAQLSANALVLDMLMDEVSGSSNTGGLGILYYRLIG